MLQIHLEFLNLMSRKYQFTCKVGFQGLVVQSFVSVTKFIRKGFVKSYSTNTINIGDIFCQKKKMGCLPFKSTLHFFFQQKMPALLRMIRLKF